MLESIVTAIGKLFEELTLKRFMSILVFVVLAVGAVLFYERYTSSFQLSRIERAAEVLRVLREVEGDGFDNSTASARMHAQLTEELQRAMNTRPLSIRLPSLGRGRPGGAAIMLLKFGAGGFLWFLMAFFTYRRGRRGEVGAGAAAGFFAFFGVIFGAFGLLIPTYAWPWLNLLVYPFGHIVLLLALLIVVAFKASPPGAVTTVQTRIPPRAP